CTVKGAHFRALATKAFSRKCQSRGRRDDGRRCVADCGRARRDCHRAGDRCRRAGDVAAEAMAMTRSARLQSRARGARQQARELGPRIGTDGVSEIVMLAPCRVPTAMLRWLESQLHEYRWEVVAIINAGGRSRARKPT